MYIRKATVEDIDILLKCRIEILISARGTITQKERSEVENGTKVYYKKRIASGDHVAFLAFNDQRETVFLGTGGICFYSVLPTCSNLSGVKGYIINMYTDERYRRHGVASHILDALLHEASERNITYVSLEATEMGQALYRKFGFEPMIHDMENRKVDMKRLR